ncbi:hypothetical protein [Collimonas humicola]|uniref:hypothetical protein n=1 Tax=Collimonas humicola TaxID=2825886 RepID=UPI001B8C89D9|nr:hypothetical protein [Collimonas humicola]
MKNILFSLITFFMAACAQGSEMILESKDVQFFKMVEAVSSSSPILEISGLAFHSSLAVSEMTSKLENESLSIFVHLVPVKKGLSGNFTYEIPVLSGVNEIRFGNQAVVIWKRGYGPTSPK